MALLVAGWLARSIVTGVWLPRTPLNRPIAALLIMTLISLYPSVDLVLSMPKFYGILLGLFIYFATVSNINSERRIWIGVWLLVASIVPISLLGIVGAELNTHKLPVMQQIYSIVPRLVGSVQTSFGASSGFNPNELGGTLAFLLPLPLALIFGARIGRGTKLALSAVALLDIMVLALTASRSAFLAMAVAALALLAWRWRRIGVLASFTTAAAAGTGLLLSPRAVADLVLRVDANTLAAGGGTLAERLEIWDRARYMIQDFPFTGIGLNTFPVILNTLYPSFLLGLDARTPHAHNIFLQTTIDLGFGGLLAFLALWGCAAFVGWTAYRHMRINESDRTLQAMVIGLLLCLLSYLVFGLIDAITLGAKPTVLLWLMMGLLVSIQRITANSKPLTPVLEVVPAASDPLLGRLARLVVVTARDSYWIVTFTLVALGLLVTGAAILGRIL